jgi:WD40 repeat protein
MDLRTGKAMILQAFNPQSGVAFSPDGRLLATGGYGTHAKLWDVATGRLLRSLDAGPREGGLTPVFSLDGKTIAVGHRNAETRLFDAESGKRLHELPRTMSQELKFSPDGRALAVGYVDGGVALWDSATGALLRSAATAGKEIYTLDWTPAGDVLVTAGLQGKIILWDPRELKALKELDAPEWVIRVRFSPDGNRLYSAGGTAAFGAQDRKVTVWGLTVGVEK